MTDFSLRPAVDSILEKAIIGQPRSQQRMIGPSEIGAECEHCLAAKLAGWEQRPDAAWLPFIGTAVHATLAEIFAPKDEWLVETRLSVGRIGDFEVLGTGDLFHIPTGTVLDWKIVGATTLRKAKGGPSPVYRCQIHTYGLGFLRAGYDVQQVAIYYLPRNAVSLSQGVWFQEEFSPLIALEALERATRILDRINAEGDGFITDLPRAKDCYDCQKYHDWQGKSAATSSLDELLGV